MKEEILLDTQEKRLRQQISNLHKFILKYYFSKKPVGTDDYVDVCKICKKEGFGPLSIRHNEICEVGKLF